MVIVPAYTDERSAADRQFEHGAVSPVFEFKHRKLSSSHIQPAVIVTTVIELLP